jgi:tellurite resistance protein TerB
MAVCALAAAADDEVSLAEHYRIDHVLANEPALMALDAEKAVETLYEYIYALRTHKESAEEVLHKKVRRMAGNRKRARTLMRVAYLVITADDEIRDTERETFRQLCGLLDLSAEEVWGELDS